MKTTIFKYDMIGTGPVEHPQKVFLRWLSMFSGKATLVDSLPMSLGDCWIFKVEHPDDFTFSYLPCYVRKLEGKDIWFKREKD